MGSGKTYNNDEIQYIKENWKHKTDYEMSLDLNRPIGSISNKRKKMGLIRDKHKYTFDDIIEEFNKTNYILKSTKDDYIDSAQKTLKYICPKHFDKGIQLISLGHLQNGRGCFYCGREKTENAKKLDINNNATIISLCNSKGFEYVNAFRKNSKIYIEYICKKHINKGIQIMQYQNMKRDSVVGCPFCGITKGEKAIMNVLDNLGIEYKYQHIFDDFKKHAYFRFDYYLPKYNKIIEFDGIQHYEPTRFNGIPYEVALKNYRETQEHDIIKNKYCESNGIPLLRIPFYDFNNIEYLIIEFLKE